MNKSEKFWDGRVDSYDKQGQKPRTTPIKAVEITKPYLEKSNIVLDYGCATGTRTNILADNVKEIWGIDISSKMIEEAKSLNCLFLRYLRLFLDICQFS